MATTTITKTEKLVGKRIRRREDPRLITGTATYVDDIKMPGMLYAAILRSPHAAAKIRSIDISKAAALKGVHAVFVGKDTENAGAVPCGASLPGLRVPHHNLLAIDRVYLVGHPVAVVVATDRYIARDGVELIEVDYEPDQAVADPEKALAPGAHAVHPQWPDNVAFTFHQEGGDVAKAFAEADVIVKQRIVSQRLIPNSMETRGVVADWRAADRSMTLFTSTQAPHLVRSLVAQILGLEENRFRVVAPEVGGGFGAKIQTYAEEILLAYISMKLQKPVKWIESRRENFLCTIHGRGHVDFYEIAAKRDGTITGIKLKIIQDLGAYFTLLTPGHPHAQRADDAGPVSHAQHLGRYRGRVHQLHAHRRVSRCGTSGSHPRHRAHGGYGCGRAQDGSGRDPPEELRPQRGVSVPHGHRPGLRFGRLFRAAQEGHGDGQLRQAPQGAGRGAQAGQVHGHRPVRLWRDLRVRSVARHARRRLGKRHGEDRAVGHRSPC